MSIQTSCHWVVGALVVAAIGTSIASPSAQSPAPPSSIQTSLSTDVGTLSDKFVGLAKVMTGKYDWRPGPGVRSVSEVFNLIVSENKMLTGLLTGAPSQGGLNGPQITDPAQLQEALTSSYAALKQSVSGLSATDLNATVTLFGRQMTKQGAVLFLMLDQHEHLGQSIAYARTNGVVPPWSK
jgi:uncharacterized damage-inducible protein DinB